MDASPSPPEVLCHSNSLLHPEDRNASDRARLPSALLNGDYKIYSRLLLNRVRDALTTTLSPTQFGFAPGRQVHDAIDVWFAVQRHVHERRAPDSTTAVLLDFAKPYDTLDRDFLSDALRRHGFPNEFVHAIADIHLAATARFLAAGELSDEVAIHNGIRQGCPLAPVLFVLAIDLLYQAADCDPELPGVQLSTTARVVLAGYADDTKAYHGKCMVVCCSKTGPTQAHTAMSLSVLPGYYHN